MKTKRPIDLKLPVKDRPFHFGPETTKNAPNRRFSSGGDGRYCFGPTWRPYSSLNKTWRPILGYVKPCVIKAYWKFEWRFESLEDRKCSQEPGTGVLQEAAARAGARGLCLGGVLGLASRGGRAKGHVTRKMAAAGEREAGGAAEEAFLTFYTEVPRGARQRPDPAPRRRSSALLVGPLSLSCLSRSPDSERGGLSRRQPPLPAGDASEPPGRDGASQGAGMWLRDEARARPWEPLGSSG